MPVVDKTNDAIALWQQMVGEMQKGFRTFGAQLPSTQSKSSEQPAGSGTAQKRLAELTESYFAGMNLPSRAQLTAVLERVQTVERELGEIKALLHEVLKSRAAPEASPRPAGSQPKRAAPGKPRREAKTAAAEPGKASVPGATDKPS
jgi:hypothetical protein